MLIDHVEVTRHERLRVATMMLLIHCHQGVYRGISAPGQWRQEI